MQQAQSESDKTRIEEKMRSDPQLARYLAALQETDKEDIVQEERARRETTRRYSNDFCSEHHCAPGCCRQTQHSEHMLLMSSWTNWS